MHGASTPSVGIMTERSRLDCESDDGEEDEN